MASDIETDVEEPEVEQVAETVEQVEEPQVEQRAILDYLSNQGYRVDEFSDDNEVLQEFGQLAGQLETMPSEDELSNLRYWAELGRRAQLEQEEPADPEPEVDQPSWNPPQINEQTYNLAERDPQTGMWKAKTGYEQFVPPNELAALNQYDQWKQEQAQNFWKNPYEFMAAGLQPHLSGMVNPLEERLKQLEGYFQQQQADSFFATQDGLAELNDAGQVTGLTKKGEAFRDAYQQAPQGLDENQRLEWAQMKTAQWAASQTVPEPPAEKKKKFLERAADSPQKPSNRDASEQWSSKNGEPQNAGQTLAQMALEDLRRRGKLVE